MDKFWPNPPKKIPRWKGIGFCCNYKCILAPNRKGLYFSILLITVPFFVFAAFPIRYFVQRSHYWVVFVSIFLLFSSLSSLFITHLIDPGILPPRPPPPIKWIKACSQSFIESKNEKKSFKNSLNDNDENFNLNDDVSDEKLLQSFNRRQRWHETDLKAVYCHTCHIWRTPRSFHCSDCGVGK